MQTRLHVKGTALGIEQYMAHMLPAVHERKCSVRTKLQLRLSCCMWCLLPDACLHACCWWSGRRS